MFSGGKLAADGLDYPLIYTRVPLDAADWFGSARADGMLPSDFFEGSQLVLHRRDGSYRVISTGFHSACDPEVSFDAERVLFSAKKSQADNWNIYEADLEAGTVRQVTSDFGNCRNPRYMSTFYTIVSPEPWYTLAFVSDVAEEASEYGGLSSTNLYSCKLDGTGLQRLTYNPSHDYSPLMLPDGRILYSSWQRNLPEHGEKGRIELFSILSDGADVSVFNRQGKKIKHMAAVNPAGQVIFVESEHLPWDGAGSLGSTSLKRYAFSYDSLDPAPGFYLYPSALPDDRFLVSKRPADGSGNHDIFLFDPGDNSLADLIADSHFHLMQAVAVTERSIPDGRSSVVNENDPNGELYCLNVSISDSEQFSSRILDEARRVRFVEGVPGSPGQNRDESMLGKRILGEVDLHPDGSFFVALPANTPFKVQLIGKDGMSLRSGSWIWVRNHEPRGCIGCHEDPEMVPDNRMVDAVKMEAMQLTLPPDRRRSVSLHEHLLPVIERHCSTASCHGEGSDHVVYLPRAGDNEEISRRIHETLTAPPSDSPVENGGYVVPGRARTSPLIWHLTGKNTTKEWDPATSGSSRAIAQGPKNLSPAEIRMFMEWIDLGAQWKIPN